METKQKSKVEIINETVAFYSEDVSRRSGSADGGICVYVSTRLKF